MEDQNQDNHPQGNSFHLKVFAFLALFSQIAIMILFCFTQFQTTTISSDSMAVLNNMMIFVLVGFGFLMSYIKQYSYSSILYTFFITAFCFQINVLGYGMWSMTPTDTFVIPINEQALKIGSYGVISVLIAMGAIFGKIQPHLMFVLALFGSIGYTCLEGVIHKYAEELSIIQNQRFYGNGNCYVFGAFYGLMIKWVLCSKLVHRQIQKTYITMTVSIIGGFFMWIYWPSMNSLAFSQAKQRSYTIMNTTFSMIGSFLGSIAIASIVRDKYYIQDLLFGSFSGGIILSYPGHFINKSIFGICLGIGFATGIVSTIFYVCMNDEVVCQCSEEREEGEGRACACSVKSCCQFDDVFGSFSIFLLPSLVSPALAILGKLLGSSDQKCLICPLVEAGLALGFSFLIGLISGITIRICTSLREEDYYNERLLVDPPIETVEREDEERLIDQRSQ